MSKNGPIILIDDDHDDKDIFEIVIHELNISNELIYFERCSEAMDYLLNTSRQPFIIFCDVNLPVCNGLEFKQNVDNNPVLRQKSIPFIFYSTSIDQFAVNKAYSAMTIQGFFKKEVSIEKVKQTVKMVMEYWIVCRHPNS